MAPSLFETERIALNWQFMSIAPSLRCHGLSESARPRANLPPSPNCMRILQTVWRMAQSGSNPSLWQIP